MMGTECHVCICSAQHQVFQLDDISDSMIKTLFMFLLILLLLWLYSLHSRRGLQESQVFKTCSMVISR
jgi:hypothetical protein